MKNRILLNVICILLIIIPTIGIYLIVNDVRTIEYDSNVVYQEQMEQIPQIPQMPNGTQSNMDIGNRPEMPDNEYQPMDNMYENNRDKENQIQPTEISQEVKFTTAQSIMIVIYTLVIATSIMMLIYTRFFNKKLKDAFINKDKIIIFILSSLLISGTLSFIIIEWAKNSAMIIEEDAKETTADDIASGENIKGEEINLNDYSTNVTITEAGTYTLVGELNHSVLINADGKVTLNLNGVDITSEETAAIANRTTNDLVINLVDGTTNNLSDGGNSEYDSSLYSNGHLYIEGNGKLNVYGKQTDGEGIATTDNDITINGGIIYIESNDDGINAGGDNGGTITINNGTVQIKASGDGIDSNDNIVINGGIVYAMGSATGGDAGIDADNGYEINGGLVIALGSDMLESPNNTSKQNVICFNLNEMITSETLITLIDKQDSIITSFIAKENFRTLIISSPNLDNGTYYLYQNGTNNGQLDNSIYTISEYVKGNKITISNKSEFTISSNITIIQ